ncbi:hypothetical protein [Chryseobacterium arthrosphaerae]|uniref:Uncharacterized protein n=1 Tax=Chryseobacterium arthrosphaerae TaxID=651561 RepID=A0A1B8ZS64_9FLAO|nr:hypothetical protein [Chryseobacterium arthrosphaerae]OCA74428.1 hypothetical protein BBI00_08840 [Chryseobacterium arthrosphaerae]
MKPKLLTTISQVQDTLNIESVHIERAPVPIEAFDGNKRAYFQMISRQFSQTSRFGLFNVMFFSGNYKERDQSADLYCQAMLTAQVWKGISLAAIVPRDPTQTNNFETFASFGYKSRLSENWGIYTRVQGLFNYNMKSDFHGISNIYLRMGLS